MAVLRIKKKLNCLKNQEVFVCIDIVYKLVVNCNSILRINPQVRGKW